MIARLYIDGELTGTCKIPGADISVIRFGQEYYVYNDNLRGYELARAWLVFRIESAPPSSPADQPKLPLYPTTIDCMYLGCDWRATDNPERVQLLYRRHMNAEHGVITIDES